MIIARFLHKFHVSILPSQTVRTRQCVTGLLYVIEKLWSKYGSLWKIHQDPIFSPQLFLLVFWADPKIQPGLPIG